jgi:chromosome partitioning protein
MRRLGANEDGTLVLAVMSVKGGVGKTTAAVNLAFLSAASGRRTLLWDLDPQGAATYVLRVDEPDVPPIGNTNASITPGTDVSITDHDHLDVLRNGHHPGERDRLAGGMLPTALERLRPWYDVVLFDCAAGLDAPVADAVAVASVVLVPVLPSPLGARTLEQVDAFVARQPHRPPVVPFFSMVDRRRRLHRDIVQSVQLERPATLSAQVVDAAVVERMGARMEPVLQFAPDSGVAAAYRALWTELLERCGADAAGRSA